MCDNVGTQVPAKQLDNTPCKCKQAFLARNSEKSCSVAFGRQVTLICKTSISLDVLKLYLLKGGIQRTHVTLEEIFPASVLFRMVVLPLKCAKKHF